MLIKPLMLGVSITLALLSLTILLRFLIYPLWLNIKSKRKQTARMDLHFGKRGSQRSKIRKILCFYCYSRRFQPLFDQYFIRRLTDAET